MRGILGAIVCIIISFGCLAFAGYLIGLQNPTETHSEIITISERQILSSPLVRDYYIITPENKWYLCYEYNNTFTALQPGHTYSVIIKKPVPKHDYINDTSIESEEIRKSLQKTDMDLRMGYTGEMIIGVNEEIKNNNIDPQRFKDYNYSAVTSNYTIVKYNASETRTFDPRNDTVILV
jgi:hypothetical protein